MNEQERLQILEMIEKGVITAEQGVRLLNSLQGPEEQRAGDQGEPAVEAKPQLGPSTSAAANAMPATENVEQPPITEPMPASAPYQFDQGVKKWRRWWWIPLTVGIVITVVSGLLMFFAYQASGFGFWFACLWFPLLLGVVVISLAASSRTMRWLHVRIQQEPGEWPQTIAISMPVPIRFTAWVLRVFGRYIPHMDRTNLDEVILALDKTSPDQPFYVRVDEADSGEKVEVFIG